MVNMPTISFSSRGASRARLHEDVAVSCNGCGNSFSVDEEYFNFDTAGENEIAGDLYVYCPNCKERIKIWFRRLTKPDKKYEYINVETTGADLVKGFGKEAEVNVLKNISLIRKVFNEKLIKLIASNPQYLQDIEWRELEHLLSVAFERIGFGVELTPSSKDGGKDIVLTCRVRGDDHTYYVEVKHWRSHEKVGKRHTTEFLNVIVNEGVSGGLFISTYGQSKNAIESLTSIDRRLLKFGDERKIETICKTYIKTQEGLVIPEESLVDILYEYTI
jgi:restriction system protein